MPYCEKCVIPYLNDLLDGDDSDEDTDDLDGDGNG